MSGWCLFGDEKRESFERDFNISKAYTFAGWYSQTFDRTTKLWSEMSCVSTEMTKPFITTATTDTNIVAMFTEVTNLSFTFDAETITVTFDLEKDSCGIPISSITKDGKTTISGWFQFNSTPSILISPTGGYRIADSYTYTYTHPNSTTPVSSSGPVSYETDTFISFMKYVGGGAYETVNFKDISLTDVTYMKFDLLNFMKAKVMITSGDEEGQATGFSSINIDLGIKHVVLTYFEVNAFYVEPGDSGTKKVPNDFMLYSQRYDGGSYVFDELLVFTSGYNSITSKVELYTEYKIGTTTYQIIGQDSAHNKISVSVDAGGSLVVYGYFDYDDYNDVYEHHADGTKTNLGHTKKALVTSLVDRGVYDDGEDYKWWIANGTQKAIGSDHSDDASSMITIWKNTKGVSTTPDILSKKIVYYYYDTASASMNNDAQLSENNHMIYLVASKTAVKYLKVTEQFYYVDATQPNGTVLVENSANFPQVPINFSYNAAYYGCSRVTESYGNYINDQGRFIFNYKDNHSDDSDDVFYKFEDPEVPNNKNKLTATLSKDYEFVKFKDKYYMFVGFKFNGEIVKPTVTSDGSFDIFKYDFNNKVPTGEFAAVYIEIMPITIYTSSGGTYGSEIQVVEPASGEYPFSIPTKIGIATLVSLFKNDGSYDSVYQVDSKQAKINYVVRGVSLTIYPTSNAGYTIDTAEFKKKTDTEYTTIAQGAGLNQYTKTIGVYEEEYIFNYEYTDAYILTLKQYMMSSVSASATASLYESKTVTMLFNGLQSSNRLNELYNVLKDGDTENDYVFDNMTLELAQGQDFFMYYIVTKSLAFIGFYCNGKLMVPVESFEAIENNPDSTKRYAVDISALNDVAVGSTTDDIFVIDIKDGETILYTIYGARYSAVNEFNYTGAMSDLTLESRFASFITVQTQIDGLAKSIEDSTYPYETVFDSTKMSVDTSTGINVYTIATYKELSKAVNNTQNVTNKITISSGGVIDYNIQIVENTEYSFVYYYFYKRYPITQVKVKNADGTETPIPSWYEVVFNNEKCYYYSENDTIYKEQSTESDRVKTNVEMINVNGKNFITSEFILSNSSKTGIEIKSTYAENLAEDETLTIYAKFAQVVEFSISKEIFVHNDDLLYKTQNPDTFEKYFDAAVRYYMPNGTQINVNLYDITKDPETGRYTIRIKTGSKVLIYPYIAPEVENRYTYSSLITLYDGTGTPIVHNIELSGGVFEIDTGSGDAALNSELVTTIRYLSSYTVKIDKTVDGQKVNDEVEDASKGIDYAPLINITSVATYMDFFLNKVKDIHYLSYYETDPKTQVVTLDVPNYITYHNTNDLTLSYVFSNSSASGTVYTTQTISTSVEDNPVVNNLVFHGWYLNGYLYTQESSVDLPLNSRDTAEGYIIIYDKETKTITNFVPLQYSEGVYSFEYAGVDVYLTATDTLNNFSGSINAEFGYEYMAYDNINLTAAYGTYTKVTYETLPEGDRTNTHIVPSTITTNMLSVTTEETKISGDIGKFYTYNNESKFNALYKSKLTTTDVQDERDLKPYKLTSSIESHTIDTDCIYAQNGSNLLITGGHLLGYRVTGYTYSGHYIEITKVGKDYIYESKSFEDGDENFPITILSSGEDSMGYIVVGNGKILTDIKIKTIYEKVYQISTVVSTMDSYDDENSHKVDASTGGKIQIYTFERGKQVNVSDGVFYSSSYPMLAITCTPNENYTFAGLYINGVYMAKDKIQSNLESYNYDRVSAENGLENLMIIDTADIGYYVTYEKLVAGSVYDSTIEYNSHSRNFAPYTVNPAYDTVNWEPVYEADGVTVAYYVATEENTLYTADYRSEDGDLRQDLIVEAKFARNMKFTVRLAMQTTDREKLKDYGITSALNEKFNVQVTLKSDFASIVYGASGEMQTQQQLTKSIWSMYEPVNEGDIYDSSISYSTSEFEYVPYTQDPATNSARWRAVKDEGGNIIHYAATRNNGLYIVDDDEDNQILKLEYTIAYGTYVDLSILENVFTTDVGAYKFDGWYLYRGGHVSTSISAINYSTSMQFYATQDFYGSTISDDDLATIDIIAKYIPTDDVNDFSSSKTVSTKKSVEFVDITSNYEANNLKDFSLNSISSSNFQNNVLTWGSYEDEDGNSQSCKYLFTGWWEAIADSTRPTTYILVASDYYAKLPIDYVDNLIARFVRILPIEITLPKHEAGYVQSRINYRYFYTPTSNLDNRLSSYVTKNESKPVITFEIPVDSYFNSTQISAYAGHYFTVSANGTTAKYDDFIINDANHNVNMTEGQEYESSAVTNRINNTTGDRYNLKSLSYIRRDGITYYINGVKLYMNVIVNGNEINYANEYTAGTYKVLADQNIVTFTVNGDVKPYNIITVSYVVYDSEIYYVRGSGLYSSVDAVAKVDNINYLVSNSVVIIENEFNFIIGKPNNTNPNSNPLLITDVGKAGYKYVIKSTTDILSIVNGGHTISYVVTTIDSNNSYGNVSDNNIGGTLEYELKTTGGSNPPDGNNNVYSAVYSMLYLKATPTNKNYRLVGIYINGKYHDGSYNKEYITINLAGYKEDLVIEAKFAILVQTTYRIVVDSTDQTKVIREKFKLTELSVNGNITNIYNSVYASYQYGDNKITSASVIVNDIDLYMDSTSMYFTLTVPYGTLLSFGVTTSTEKGLMFEEQPDGSETSTEVDYNFNGWYMLTGDLSTSSNNLVSTSERFDVYAVTTDTNELSFFAKYTTGDMPDTSPSTKVKIYTQEDGETTPTEYLFNSVDEFEELHGAIQPVKEINGKTYLFTGWWQDVNGKVILIANKPNDSKRLNSVAVYVEMKTIIVNYTESSSVSMFTNIHQAFAYIQPTTVGDMALKSYVDTVNTSINIVTTICSALKNISLSAENGYQFENAYGQFTDAPITNPVINNDKFSISSNLADVVDTHIRYSNIYSDLDYFELNLSADSTVVNDIVKVEVLNNENSFKVSIISQNTSIPDDNTSLTSKSPVYVVSNNISLTNKTQEQFYANNIKSIYLGTTQDLYYIYEKNATPEFYSNLKSYKSRVAGFIYEANFVVDGTPYDFVVTTDNDVVFEDDTRLALEAIFGSDFVAISKIENNQIYIYSNVDGYYPFVKYEVDPNVITKTKDYFFEYSTAKTYHFTVDAGKANFAAADYNELRTLIGGDFVAEVTEDTYTLYIYSDKEDLNATITDNGLYCEIMETVPNTSTEDPDDTMEVPVSYVINRNVVDRYYPSYTHLTITLSKEYRTESFVGFEIYHESGNPDVYPVELYGYSLSINVSESIKVIAKFETAVNYPLSALDASGNAGVGNQTGASGSTEYGDGGAATITTFTNASSASDTRYIHSVTISGLTFEPVVYTFEYPLVDPTSSSESMQIPAQTSDANEIYLNYNVLVTLSDPVTDDFGRRYFRQAKVEMNAVAGARANVTFQTFNIYELNIILSQNEGADVTNGTGATSEVKMFYPHDYLDSLTVEFLVGKGIALEDIELFDKTPTYNYINNRKLFLYVKHFLDSGSYCVIAGSGAEAVTFDATLGNEAFVDGFYSTEISHNANPANGSKLDGKKAEDFNTATYKFTANVVDIIETTLSYNLVYNYKQSGTIRVYIHPLYKDGSNYNAELDGSVINPTMSEYNYILDSVHAIDTEGVDVTTGVEYNIDATMARKPGSTVVGAYYIEFEFYFSAPLVLLFNSSNLSFNRYYYYNEGSGVTELKSQKYPALSTNDSALSISYREYNTIISEQETKGRLELHCDASESIRATTITFEYEQPSINLLAIISDNSNNRTKYKSSEPIVGIGKDGTPEKKIVTLQETAADGTFVPSGRTKLVNIFLGTTQIEKEVTQVDDFGNVTYTTVTVSAYYIQIMFGNELTSTGNTPTEFNVEFIDFVSRYQFSVDQETASDDNVVFIKDLPGKDYYIGFRNAYCSNATQTIERLDTGRGIGKIPTYTYTIGSNFSEGSEIIVETEKYYKILFAKNYIRENANPRVIISIYKPGPERVIQTTIGTQNSAICQNDGKFSILPSGDIDTPAKNSEFYIYAYVPDGSIVKIEAEDIVACDSGDTHTTKIYYKNRVNCDSDLFTRLQHKDILSSATDTGSTDVINNLFQNITVESVSSKSTQYMYVPTANGVYLADYITTATAVTDTYLVGVLAPGNSSKFVTPDSSTAIAQVYSAGFNFVMAIRQANESMTVNQVVTNEDIRYSQYEAFEENKELYMFEGSDETVDSVKYSTFESSSLTYFMYGGNAKQFVILVKTATNINDVTTGYYKQSTLPIRSDGSIIDHVYKTDIFDYSHSISASKPATGSVQVLYSSTGSVELTAIPDTFNKNTSDSANFVSFSLESSKVGTAADNSDKVLVHAMTLLYGGAYYYFTNGSVYMEVQDTSGSSGTDRLEEYSLSQDNLYVNVRYKIDTTTNEYYPTKVEVYELIYKFTVGGDTYTVEFDRTNRQHIIKRNGTTVTTSTTKFSCIDGRICLITGNTRTYRCEVLIKNITSDYCKVFDVVSIDEVEEQTGDFASMSICANIYDSQYNEQVYDESTGLFLEMTEDNAALADNNNLLLIVETENVKKSYYHLADDGKKYYVLGNKVYSDEERLYEVTTIGGKSVTGVMYNKLKIGSRYSENPTLVSTNVYSYTVGMGSYRFYAESQQLQDMSTGNVLKENEDYQLLEPKIKLGDGSTLSTQSETLYLNSVKFDDSGKTYYYAHNKLYSEFPFSEDVEIDHTTGRIGPAGSSEYAEDMTIYYVAPEKYNFNGLTYTLVTTEYTELTVADIGTVIQFKYKNTDTTVGHILYNYVPEDNEVYVIPELIKLPSETIWYEPSGEFSRTEVAGEYIYSLSFEPVAGSTVIGSTPAKFYYKYNSTTKKVQTYKEDNSTLLGSLSISSSSNLKLLYKLIAGEELKCKSLNKNFISEHIIEKYSQTLDTKYTSATLTTISATVYPGYYVKGFIVASNINDGSSHDMWLNYVLDLRNSKFGLQNEQNYSLFNYCTFYPVEYKETDDTPYTSIKYNINLKLTGSFRIYAVYAPIIYQISVVKVNIQDMIDDAIENTTIVETQKVTNLLSGVIKAEDSTSGYIKGRLLAEYGNDTWIKAKAYDGNIYLGYSIGAKTQSNSIKTSYIWENIDPNVSVTEIRNNLAGLSETLSIAGKNETSYDSSMHDFTNNLSKYTDSIEDGKQYFMSSQAIKFDATKQNIEFTDMKTNYNNIVMHDVKTDIELYVYYQAVAYDLEIQIGELDQGKSEGSGNGTYLSYADSSSPDFINSASISSNVSAKYPFAQITIPEGSSGDFKFKDDTNVSDAEGKVSEGKDNNKKLTIQTNSTFSNVITPYDSYVYTIYDNYGKLITSADGEGQEAKVSNNYSDEKEKVNYTKVKSSLINFKLSDSFNFLVYNANANGDYYVPSTYATPLTSEFERVTDEMVPGYSTGFAPSTGRGVQNAVLEIYRKKNNGVWEYYVKQTARSRQFAFPNPIDFNADYNKYTGSDWQANNWVNDDVDNFIEFMENVWQWISHLFSWEYNKISDYDVQQTNTDPVAIDLEYTDMLYKVIPYDHMGVYAEYSVEYIEENVNKSEKLEIESSDFITSKTVGDVKSTQKTVASNNKYIYTALKVIEDDTANNQLVTFNFNNEGDYDVSHVMTDEVNTSYDFLTFNVRYSDAIMIVPATLSLGTPQDGEDWWTNYTLDNINNIFDEYRRNYNDPINKENYEKAMKAVIQTSSQEFSVDTNVMDNKVYNISETNIQTSFEYYSTYVNTSYNDGYVYSLKEGLFKLTVDDTEIDSSDFKSNTNTIVITKGLEQQTFFGTLLVSQTTGTQNEQLTSVIAKIKLFYGKNNSLPVVNIVANSVATTTGGDDIIYDPESPVEQIVQRKYYGATVDYGLKTNEETFAPEKPETDTFYKPTGTERRGTPTISTLERNNSSDKDSYFIVKGSGVEGFFSNIFALSPEMTEHFERPFLNVNVKLIYEKNLKTIEPTITIHGDTDDYDVKGTKPEDPNTVYKFNLFNEGTESIFDDSVDGFVYDKNGSDEKKKDVKAWHADNNSLYSDSIFKKDVNDEAKNWRISGWSFKHYFVYVIVDAYTILDMLNIMAYDNTLSQDVRLQSYLLSEYIITFDPELYKDSKGNYPEYVFDADHVSANGEMYSYDYFYTFIDTHYMRNGLLHTHGLPKPTANNGYLRIKTIDPWTFAKYSIDSDFVENTFTQKDMFITSMLLKEKYQLQVSYTWLHTGMMTTNWQANQPYSYFDYSYIKTNYKVDKDAYSFEHNPTVMMSLTIAQTEDAKFMEDVTEPDGFAYAVERNALREMIRFTNGTTEQFFSVMNASLAIDVDEYAANRQITPSVDIYSYTVKYHNKDEGCGMRIRTEVFDYQVKSYAAILSEIGEWLGAVAAAIGIAAVTIATAGAGTALIVGVAVTAGVLATAAVTLTVLSEIGVNKPWYERAFNIFGSLLGYGIFVDQARLFTRDGDINPGDYEEFVQSHMPSASQRIQNIVGI